MRAWLSNQAYSISRWLCRVTMLLLVRYRAHGRERFPQDGGAVVCSNHQSVLDPLLIGLASNRRMSYLARDTLFRSWFGSFIKYFGAIPIDREGSGLAGLKETMRRLKQGKLVLMFPEGTRTRTGAVGLLRPGFCSLVRRCRVPIVPVGFDGAYDAWPRTASLPRRSRVEVVVGELMSVELMKGLSDEELVAELHSRIVACHAEARCRRLSRHLPTGDTAAGSLNSIS